MDCIIHYDGYTDTDETVIPLSKDKFEQLKVAANARHEMGGEHVSNHSKQIRNIPNELKDNTRVHWKCYKKFIMSINVLANKNENENEKISNRPPRTGELKQTILPNICQFCEKGGKKSIKGSSRKQPLAKITLESAEDNIRVAAELKSDERMLVITRGIKSLRAAEFKMHEKCFKDYTRIVPAKKPRAKTTETYTSADDGDIVGGYAMRKRSKVEYNENLACEDNENMTYEDKGDTEIVIEGFSDAANDDDGQEMEIVQTKEFTPSNNSTFADIDMVIDDNIQDVEETLPFKKGNKDKLFDYIQKQIVDDNKCASMKTLTDVFGLDGSDRRNRHYVKQIIQLKFAQNLLYLTVQNEPQIVTRCDAKDSGDILHQSNQDQMLQMAANILREHIDTFIDDEKKEVEVWPPTYKSLMERRSKYPQSLEVFFTTLLKPKVHSASDNVIRIMKSMSDDIVHFLSNGSVLTLKPTLVGCGLHSMDGSSKSVKILNKLNNSISYDRVREIETAQAETALKFSGGTFPLPLIPKDEASKVLFRIWWDNFDSKVENKEGSIHTTHGVAFTEESPETIDRNTDSIQVPRSKNRRSLEAKETNLPNPNIDPRKLPPSLEGNDIGYDNMYASALPLIWRMQGFINRSHQTVSHRFIGWVSKTFGETQPKTRITFLPVIRRPITQYCSVLECIYQSIKYSEQCNMKYTHITTDEGAAEKFYRVKWNNPENFKNVILHLGDFHGMQALFGVIGKLVSNSGFEDVLYQANLCTSGGINGVLAGKHYNRSWAVHECLSETMRRLFHERENASLTISKDLEEAIQSAKDKKSCKDLIDNPNFIMYIEKYSEIQKKYLSGEKGKTAQFWMQFLDLIELLHLFHYSINLNDFGLRLVCWKKLITLCFPTNKRNYARYGTYYVKTLENLEITHPGAIEELSVKGVSIRRNEIGIGQSIDGAGEQTFQRASKTSGGIRCFMNNAAAYDKWVLCRPFQAKFVEGLLEIADLGNNTTAKKCLRPSEISKSEKRVLSLKSVLTDTFIDPFEDTLDPNKLFNIASGSSASDEVSSCLLDIYGRGKILYDEFDSRCTIGKVNENTFWTVIKRQDWKDFSNLKKKSKVKAANGKIVEVTAQRDMLGLLLVKSQELESPIDMNEALKYSLGEVAYAIAHGDGKKRKTNKSMLYTAAIASIQAPLSNVTEGTKVYVLDLAAVLRSTVKVPNTIKDLAVQLLEQVPRAYDIIYIACDTYKDESIKSEERKGRGESDKLLMKSAKVRLPSDFQKFLCNGDNKERLFELIEKEWVDQKELIGNRIVYFARSNSCSKITNAGYEDIPELETNHEEADTKIAYLIQHSIQNNDQISEVMVRSSSADIDIPVIMIGAFGRTEQYIVIDSGTGKDRKQIRIDNSMLSEKQQKALVGFHAFTGNDYVSSFMRKTKKIWKNFVEDDEMLDFLCQLGEGELTDDIHEAAEKFVCKMYGNKSIKSVNELRAKLFWSRTRKNGKVPDMSLLPPCASSLMLHTARAHYVAKIWRQANIPLQNIDSYINNGWLEDGSIDWISRPYPENVECILMDKSSDPVDVDVVDEEFDENDDDNDEIDDVSDEEYEM